tara:strand:+ start:3069 stop:5246 length:2178 start_codon:yes stop_codon:yes gene_type:complete
MNNDNININNNNNMNIVDFVEKIENDCKKPIFRYIQVNVYDGKKDPVGTEKNNMTPQDISKNRGNSNHNSVSIYLKHIPDLYVVDFDTKDNKDNDFYKLLNNDNIAMTETNKGSHYYIKIKNMPVFTNQQKILVDKDIDCDLLKTNNCWETKNRIINGTIKSYEWDNIKQYFNIKKLGIDSLPVSPVNTPDNSDEDSYTYEWVDTPLPLCNEADFKKHIESFKQRYEYNDWLKVGIICYNNFNGSKKGLDFWNSYSKHDEENYEGKKKLNEKYITFNSDGKKLSYKQFIRWNIQDYPVKNKYEGWYKQGIFIEEMNKICMYYTITGDILYFNGRQFIRTKTGIAKTYYKKYNFDVEIDDKTNNFNPFDLWISNIDRKCVDEIVFNPKDNCRANQFNIWKGFEYKKTGNCDESKIKKWLEHIKTIWADDDEDAYNYILSWFARILQAPYNKNNICLVLHSVEGVGKTLILDMIGEIIGQNYYYSTSSLKHILGDFNGDAEGKILVNLNETNWGGDKKMVGAFKEFITDSSIVINKKGLQSYTISNYANTIITTNEDWIIAINGQDRRFNLRECKNEKYDKSYYKEIAQTDIQEIANFLYNRDISQYDSRVFIKSDLHREQVEMNMNSIELFWGKVINNEIDELYNNWFDVEEEEEEWRSKSHLYEKYTESIIADHQHTMTDSAFWRKLRKICPSIQYKNAHRSSKATFKYPTLEIATKEWTKYIGN